MGCEQCARLQLAHDLHLVLLLEAQSMGHQLLAHSVTSHAGLELASPLLSSSASAAARVKIHHTWYLELQSRTEGTVFASVHGYRLVLS